MSARALRRNHSRATAAARRRETRRARRAGLAAGAAVGAAFLVAPAAQGATLEVNQLTDPGDGTCDATCTVRDAVATANNNGTPDTITFATGLSGTVHLGNGNGELYLENDGPLTIVDSGTDKVTLSGDDVSRIFNIEADADVTLDSLTLIDGYYEGEGGAVVVYSDAPFQADDGDGTTLVVESTSISGSFAEGHGGGIAAFADKYSSVEIHNSTISGNHADSKGGGIYFYGYDSRYNGDGDPGTLTMSNSTVSGNDAQRGGGININGRQSQDQPPALAGALPSGGFAEIEDSTIVNNTASIGGGIVLEYNQFDAQRASGDAATGATDPFGNVPLDSTIVANNTAGQGDNDLFVTIQTGDADFVLDHSLVENSSDSDVIESPAGSNIRNTDPDLGPLADNGGKTLTHLPSPSSPAIDAGMANGETTDQRGFDRTVNQEEPNHANSDGTDIGSVERARNSEVCPLDSSIAGSAYTGNEESETIDGTTGSDIILGLGGNDTLNGKPGDDCLIGGDDDDTVNGDEDNDLGRGNSGSDTMHGGSGDDDFGSGPDDDVMDLDAGNDHGIAGGGNDKVTGGTGNDVIRGRAGNDDIDGGDGADGIKGGRGDDEIKGGDGNDKLRGGFGDDVINGGKGKDDIDCGKGQDVAIADADDKVSKDCETVK
jgi:Ca2+-binding RTX toxin-like protein